MLTNALYMVREARVQYIPCYTLARLNKTKMGKYNEKKLSVIFDKRQDDFVVKYPRSCDGALAIHHLVNDTLEYRIPSKEKEYPHNFEVTNFIKELEKRGYDIKTLKFSIQLKK